MHVLKYHKCCRVRVVVELGEEQRPLETGVEEKHGVFAAKFDTGDERDHRRDSAPKCIDPEQISDGVGCKLLPRMAQQMEGEIQQGLSHETI